jgi:predicted phosphodiesterase
MKNPNDGSPGIDRRELMKLLAVGGVVYASGLAGCAERAGAPGASVPSQPTPLGAGSSPTPVAQGDFLFLQLSDTHWGFSGPPNPEAGTTLKRAVAAINAASLKPDFIVFTGDLTQRTDDDVQRRQRLKEFQQIVSELSVKTLYFIPGEHDAAPDAGKAYRESFGKSYYSFEHKGVQFLAIDNVSAPGSVIGDEQLNWLASEVKSVPPDKPIVVFTHRPLFDLYPAWDWATKDGEKALAILQTHKNVTVFYGHIHQEHHFATGDIKHHSARSLIFPLPAPGSVPQKAPLPWDPKSPDHGLGYRQIQEQASVVHFEERPLDFTNDAKPA